MSDAAAGGVLDYYNAELGYLRKVGGEFARAHPKVAGRLQLGSHVSPDPQVERLIESFAFLTARLQRTIDVEVPAISSAMLEVLYPQYLNPVPPMAVAELVADPEQGTLSTGFRVEPGTPLFAETEEGETCWWRTTAPVVLQPLQVVRAALESPGAHPFTADFPTAAQVVRVRLGKAGVPLDEVRPESLRFYLGGEMSTGAALYELLTASLLGVALLPDGEEPPEGPRILPPEALQPAGFAPEEAALPYPATAHPAYRLLQEYFTFPRKFLFFDLAGVDGAGAKSHVDLAFVLDRVPARRLEVCADNFRLGCAPIVNLFSRLSEPVRLDQRRLEYRLVGDARRERITEVHSVLEIAAAPGEEGTTVLEPFYSCGHPMDGEGRTFWLARRVPSERADLEGTDILLSFVDLRGERAAPAAETVWAKVLCTNRTLAEQLLPGHALHAERALPVSHLRLLHPPTPAVAPPLGPETQWRLVSHLSLNHLSLSGADAGASLGALREILRLYGAWGDPTVEAQVSGIRAMTTAPAARRVGPLPWTGFCRGTEIELLLDESAYAGGSALLLAAVLERFFALYAAMNSFTRLSVRRTSREGVWKRWNARVGERTLL